MFSTSSITVKVERAENHHPGEDQPGYQARRDLLLQIVEKTFGIPELRFANKVDIPVVTQRQIRMNPDVQKTIETPQLQHTEQVVDVPVVLVAQVPRVEVVEEAVEISQFQAVKKIGVRRHLRSQSFSLRALRHLRV